MTGFSDRDLIALARSAFKGIGKAGLFKAKHFRAGDAETKKQKILYDEKTGWLSYAAKGSKTAEPVKFARIGKNLVGFDYRDIIVI